MIPVLLPALALLAPANAAEIDRLAKQLGNPDFAEREAASSRLAAIGAPAQGAVLKAADSPDAEVRDRARRLLALCGLKDYALLQGRWFCVQNDDFGSPPGQMDVRGRRVILGPETAHPDAFDIILLPELKPKGIRLSKRGHTDVYIEGIYRLDGDSLHYSVPCKGGPWWLPKLPVEGDPPHLILKFQRVR